MTNPAAEIYIANIAKHANIIEHEHNSYYAAGTVYLKYEFDAEPKGNLTAEQNYYLQALTVLGMWADNQMEMTHPDPDLERFSCDLAARRKCYEFGITNEKFGMTDRAKRIVRYLDGMQPKAG